MTAITPPPRRPLPPVLKPWRLYLVAIVVVALAAGAFVVTRGDTPDAPTPPDQATASDQATALEDVLIGRTSGVVQVRAWSSQSRYDDVTDSGQLLFDASGWIAPDGTIVVAMADAGTYAQTGLVRPGGVNDLVITPSGDVIVVTGDSPEAIVSTWITADADAANPASPGGVLQGLNLSSVAGLATIAGDPTGTSRWPDALQFTIPTGEFSAPAPGLLRWSRDRVDNAEAWLYTSSGDGGQVVVLDVVVLDPVVVGPVTRYVVALTISDGPPQELPEYLTALIAAGPIEIPAGDQVPTP